MVDDDIHLYSNVSILVLQGRQLVDGSSEQQQTSFLFILKINQKTIPDPHEFLITDMFTKSSKKACLASQNVQEVKLFPDFK